MNDQQIARAYLPHFYFDKNETIPLRAIGYTVAREPMRSLSFPKRLLPAGDGIAFTVEYACYWDYDIQHMYDLEHVWVMAGSDGIPVRAEGSFHGKYLTLWEPGLETAGAIPPDGLRVHAFCQPGKHAILPVPQLCRLVPDWIGCCGAHAGGGVLVGGPFEGSVAYTDEENDLSGRYIRKKLTFEPTLDFAPGAEDVPLFPWETLAGLIPQWVAGELDRLRTLSF